MDDLERLRRDREFVLKGEARVEDMCLLYMDRFQAALSRHREAVIDYEGKLMHKDIQIDRLLDRIHYLLNEAEGKGVMLDAKQKNDPPDDEGESGDT